MTRPPAPKALILTSSSSARGAEIEAVQLATSLRAAGFPTLVRSLTLGDPPSIEGLAPLGRWRHSPTTLGRLRSMASGADVVIAYGSRALPACAMALAGSSTPFVYRSIGDPAAWIRSDLHRRATAVQYRRAAAVAVLWPAAGLAVQQLFGVAGARVYEVPNARHPADFHPPSPGEKAAARQRLGLDDRRVALFVGSLRPEKQVALAVRTIARAEAWSLLVAGDGPERSMAEELASRLAPGRVRFLGHQRDIASVLGVADALLITSRTEGMPGAAIEAVLCGVPVVATPVGALATMHGVTVADADASALAQALDTLTPPEELSASACATYSWSTVTRTWIQLLRTVAGTSPAGVAPSGGD